MQELFRIFLLFCVLALIMIPTRSNAQMFSVKSERSYVSTPDAAVSAGFETMNFRFKGDPAVITANNDYSASGTLVKFGIETGEFNIYAMYGRNLGAASQNNITIIGGDITNKIPVIRTRPLQILLPLQVGSAYQQVRLTKGSISAEEFSQNAIYIGSGIALVLRLHETVRLNAHGIASYGFSTSGIYGTGGNISLVGAEARLYFDQIIKRYGIMVGSNFISRNYMTELDQFRYIYTGTSLVFGVTF